MLVIIKICVVNAMNPSAKAFKLWNMGCAVLLILVAGFFLIKENSYEVTNMVSAAPDYSPSTEMLEWYFMPNEQGIQPEPTPESEIIKKYDGHYIGDSDEKIIYLTFDAGYENGYTGQILDTLKKHRVPAAFFLVEYYFDSAPEMVRRMMDDGHLVCNHTANHKNLAHVTDFAEFQREVTRVEEKCLNVTGKELARYLRPPEGVYSERVLWYAQQMGYSTVFWSFAYFDWDNDNPPSRETAFAKIYPRTHNGEVALLHSTAKINADILDELLTEWKRQGYAFGSLDHLTGSAE
ncbi:MAG TPA: delta-lactam-biosynthetic de-N-acetylase [Ruminococcaceae bacterium]|nr:delta-lactam-biosynthetic de-N-acetylase [Oscillospiraceae bacterium]